MKTYFYFAGFTYLLLFNIETVSAQNTLPSSASEVNPPNALKLLSDMESEQFIVEVKSNSIICKWWPQANCIYELQRSEAGDFSSFNKLTYIKPGKLSAEYYFDDNNISSNVKYYYRLKVIKDDKNVAYTYSIAAIKKDKGRALLETHRDKASNVTSVNYVISSPSLITIEITDLAGKLIKQYSQGLQQAGQYTFPFSIVENNLSECAYNVSVWVDDEKYTATLSGEEY